MKTGLIFRISIFLALCAGISLTASAQEPFEILRVSIDTNRAAYEPGEHAIIVEWTRITDPDIVRLDIHNTTNNEWSQWEPISVITDLSTEIAIIDINDAPNIVYAVNNESYRKISVARMVPTDPSDDRYPEPTIYPEENTPFDGHRTIFLESSPDDCDEVVSLSWNNHSAWESTNSVEAYEIYESINGGPFELHVSMPGELNINFVVENIDLENLPSYLVRVVHTSGREVFSNIHTPDVDFPGTPEYMISTHSENQQNTNLLLYYEIDPASELDSFVIKRADQPQGPYNETVKMYNGNLENFTAQIDMNGEEPLSYYKLYVYNKCGKVRDSSNVNHPIILENTGNDKNTFSLEWTVYIGFDGPNQNGLSHYRLVDETGAAIEDFIPPSTTSHTLNIEDTITIRVEAIENDNGGEGHISISNTITLMPKAQVYFAEAYRIGQEPVVAPFIENTVLDYYKIQVFNRNGMLVYSHTIEETIAEFDDHQKWDGKYNNNYLPAGTYIYHMTYSTPGTDHKEVQKGYFILVE